MLKEGSLTACKITKAAGPAGHQWTFLQSIRSWENGLINEPENRVNEHSMPKTGNHTINFSPEQWK